MNISKLTISYVFFKLLTINKFAKVIKILLFSSNRICVTLLRPNSDAKRLASLLV
jgi:hypothetical protein